MTFKEDWGAAVDDKNSVLCAGLDPAAYDMQRGDKGLPHGIGKMIWALNYIDAVAPFAAALKPNLQYWKDRGDIDSMDTIVQYAQDRGLVVIDDSKLADIGATNEAGIFYSGERGFDAVTVAPFAGNLEGMATQGRKHNVGTISMCLMSNPEYEREKNKWVDISGQEARYDDAHVLEIEGKPHVRQYMQLANDANTFGVDGIVIGAPSSDNHLSELELSVARRYAGSDTLVLLPGVGAQGGEAGEIWKHFPKCDVIVNVGRALMFPNGSMSDTEDWKAAAEHYRDMLNQLRDG